MRINSHCSVLAPYLLGAAIIVMITGTALKSAAAEVKITYRQKWLLNTSTVGDLYAKVHGIFKESGLDVTIKSGGPEKDAIKELELGMAHFGVASADQVIRARSKGAPVVVVAQLFQINPLQWIYRASRKPLARLADLKGLTIGVTYGGNDEAIMRTLLAKAGLSEREVRLFGVRYDYTPFYKGKVDLWPVYSNAQGPILADKLAQSGEAVRFFNPAEFGVRFVANSVVTSEKFIIEQPDLAANFVTALLKGWREALDRTNKEKALSTIRQFDVDTPLHLLEKQLAITRQLIHPRPETPIGAIDSAAWQQTETIMLDQNQIPAPVNVVEFLKPVI